MIKTTAPKPLIPPADRFSDCIPFTLQQEMNVPGDWTNPRNLSHDPVATFCGIEQNEFTNWCMKHGLPSAPVQQMSQYEGYAIYRQNYWLPHCPVMPKGLDLQFFDTHVNQGEEAIRILQVALGVANDGIWGPVTSLAVTRASNSVPAVVEAFTARRLAVYRESKGFGEYGTDWLRRADEIGTEALKMASGQ